MCVVHSAANVLHDVKEWALSFLSRKHKDQNCSNSFRDVNDKPYSLMSRRMIKEIIRHSGLLNVIPGLNGNLRSPGSEEFSSAGAAKPTYFAAARPGENQQSASHGMIRIG